MNYVHLFFTSFELLSNYQEQKKETITRSVLRYYLDCSVTLRPGGRKLTLSELHNVTQRQGVQQRRLSDTSIPVLLQRRLYKYTLSYLYNVLYHQSVFLAFIFLFQQSNRGICDLRPVKDSGLSLCYCSDIPSLCSRLASSWAPCSSCWCEPYQQWFA